jgi:lipoprotein-releasing system permease protein
VGDKLVMILPDYSITPAGVFPRQKRLTIVGVFEVGAQQDQNLVLLNLADAKKLFRRTSIADGLRVKTRSIYEAPDIIATARDELAKQGLGEFELLDWSQTQGGLFQAVKMEKIVVGCLLMIIVAVAAFNIVTSLVLMVADKRSDIAVLRTMGMSRPQIMAVFIAQGSATGLIGMFFGALLGTLVAIYIGDIVTFIETSAGAQLFDPSVYFVSRLPSVWLWRDALTVVTVGALLSLLATLYPAYQAAKIQPAEALRYE